MPSIPGVDTGQLLSQAQNIKASWLKSGAAYLGKPIGLNLSKYEGIESKKYEKEKKTISYFFRRYIFTLGKVGGLAAILLSKLAGFLPIGDNENPSKIVGLIKGGLWFGGIVAIAGSAISQFTGYTSNFFLTGVDKMGAKGLKLLEEKSFKTLEHPTLLAKLKDSPLRYKQEEKAMIDSFLNNPGEVIKAFFVGPSGTGKTEAMYKICGKVIEYENLLKNSSNPEEQKKAREVIVRTLSGKDIAKAIQESQNSDEAKKEIAGLVASQLGVNDLLSAFAGGSGGSDLLLGILHAVAYKFDECKKNNQRLVVIFDEVDHLWDLTRKGDGDYDWATINDVAMKFRELLEKNNGHDIMLASNQEPSNILGIKGSTKEESSGIAGTEREKLNGVLVQYRVPVTAPDEDVVMEIITTYARRIMNTQSVVNSGKKPTDVFEKDISDCFSGYTTYEQIKEHSETIESKLLNVLKKKITDRFDAVAGFRAKTHQFDENVSIPAFDTLPEYSKLAKMAELYHKEKQFRNLVGRYIEQALCEDLIKQCSTGSVFQKQITFDMMLDSLLVKITLDESVKNSIKSDIDERRSVDRTDLQNERIRNKNYIKLCERPPIKALKQKLEELVDSEHRETLELLTDDSEANSVLNTAQDFFKEEHWSKETNERLDMKASKILANLNAQEQRVTASPILALNRAVEKMKPEQKDRFYGDPEATLLYDRFLDVSSKSTPRFAVELAAGKLLHKVEQFLQTR